MNNTPWLDIARREIGVKEIAGKAHNPRVVEYHQATSLGASDDETPWCSAFVNWCVQQAGLAGTNSAAARSWLQWGRPIDKPVPGCIVVFKRGTSSWQGHVGFYVGENADVIQVLGGNQSNQVKVSRYLKSDLLGYRMPKRIRDSKTITATTLGSAAVVVTQEVGTDLISMATKAQEVGDATAAFHPEYGRYIGWVIGAAVVTFVIWERYKKIRDKQI